MLRDFEVDVPVFVPQGTEYNGECVYEKLLMEYDFGNSYGAPFVGRFEKCFLLLVLPSRMLKYEMLKRVILRV